MPMKDPPHPGKAVRVSCLEPHGLSVTRGAEVLGVSRQALSNLVDCRARISGDMAIRLAKAFGSTTETSYACRRRTTWLRPGNGRVRSTSSAMSRAWPESAENP